MQVVQIPAFGLRPQMQLLIDDVWLMVDHVSTFAALVAVDVHDPNGSFREAARTVVFDAEDAATVRG